MNGILLFGLAEIIVQFIFGIIAVINILLIIKKIYPAYKKSFIDEQYFKQYNSISTGKIFAPNGINYCLLVKK